MQFLLHLMEVILTTEHETLKMNSNHTEEKSQTKHIIYEILAIESDTRSQAQTTFEHYCLPKHLSYIFSNLDYEDENIEITVKQVLVDETDERYESAVHDGKYDITQDFGYLH